MLKEFYFSDINLTETFNLTEAPSAKKTMRLVNTPKMMEVSAKMDTGILRPGISCSSSAAPDSTLIQDLILTMRDV